MEKIKKNQSLINLLEFDKNNEYCIDKIEIISVVHGTGQIKLITQKSKEISITLDDLVLELKLEQNEDIVKKGHNIFMNTLIGKCCKTRKAELEKIYKKADVLYERIENDPFGNYQVRIFVNYPELELMEQVV